EDRYTCRLVCRCEGILERPAMGVASARRENAAKRVFEAEPVVGSLADLDVCQEIEQRAAPIRTTPRGRAVQSTIGGARQPVRQALDQRVPCGLARHEASTRASERLDVGRKAL